MILLKKMVTESQRKRNKGQLRLALTSLPSSYLVRFFFFSLSLDLLQQSLSGLVPTDRQTGWPHYLLLKQALSAAVTMSSTVGKALFSRLAAYGVGMSAPQTRSTGASR
mmetsp:Transcript_16983/g.38388  ORF Transcript_16983/g.38388 Transcript_16983/m.38388 type:complete len:109 (-) Transcript_16983:998-1324(-)